MIDQSTSRRKILKSSLFGIMAVATPNIVFAKKEVILPSNDMGTGLAFYRYPAIDDERASEVVGASHGRFEKVKEMVNKRPELARATWDWGFGDWETAIGAASHMGRRDIINFLISKGARPDIFSFASLGKYEVVKNMVEAIPGVQSIDGPHGISLLQHAKNGARSDSLSKQEKEESEKLIDYLKSLGDAGPSITGIEVPKEELQKFLGEYRFGDGEIDVFTISLGMWGERLQIGRNEPYGRPMAKTAEHVHTLVGAPSVQIKFEVEGDKVLSLAVHEPELVLKAVKI